MPEVKGKRVGASLTLKRIMKNASEEFAAHGYAGARMDRIARSAGVNKAALYYHVGDKESLFNQTLFEEFGDIELEVLKCIENVDEPALRLRVFICTLSEIVARKKYLPSIMLRATASGFRDLPDGIVRIMDGLFDTYQDIINMGKRAGVFRNDFNPLIGYTMVMGSMYLLKANGALRAHSGSSGFSYSISIEGKAEPSVGNELASNLIAAIGI
jgi:AcrR family transcriptional regulator